VGSITFLLPYIEQQNLWNNYNLAKNWGDPLNIPVTKTPIPGFMCPTSPDTNEVLDHVPDGYTPGAEWIGVVANSDYGASIGVDPRWTPAKVASYNPPLQVTGSIQFSSTATTPTNGFFPKNCSLTFANVTDGLSNTIAFFESAGRPFVWQKAGRVSADITVAFTNAGGWSRAATDIMLAGSDADGVAIPGTYINRTNGDNHGGQTYGSTGFPTYGTEGSSQPFSFHVGGLNVLMGDGSVRILNENTTFEIVAAMVTRGQGDVGTN
jgi:prepilin-type processing-associated H-X9-DG protein